MSVEVRSIRKVCAEGEGGPEREARNNLEPPGTLARRSDKPMVKITAGKGSFRVEVHGFRGIYGKKVKTGYREQTVPVTIMDYEITELNIEPERN